MEELEKVQGKLTKVDLRDTKTGDEEEIIDGKEEAEEADESLAEATTGRSIAELEAENSPRSTPHRIGKSGLRSEN